MLNNVQKITLALSLAYLSDDMSVNVIRVPKLHNKFVMILSSKDASFSQIVPMNDTNEIEKFFRDVVSYFYKKVTTLDLPFRASQADIAKDADVLLSGVFLASTGIYEDQDRIEKKISESVEFTDDCIKYVNQGSREHQILKCLSSFLNEIFYHFSLCEMKGDTEFNLEETLNNCYIYAESESKDNVRKWRRRPDTQVDDDLDNEFAKLLTYAILAKNVNLDMGNEISADKYIKSRI